MAHSWEHLHNMKHTDHHFHEVKNSFICPSSFGEIWQADTSTYQQSIQMFAIIPVTLGLIYFLISISWITISSCCKASQNNNRSDGNTSHSAALSINIPYSPLNGNIPSNKATKQLKLFASISRYALALISLCIIICNIYIGAALNGTIIDVQRNWDDSYDPYDRCIDHAYSIETILQSVLNQCKSIRNAHLPSFCQDVAVPVIDQIIPKIQTTLYYLNRYTNEAEVIQWGDSSQIDPYRRYLIFVGVTLLVFIVILISVSLIKRCTDKYIWCNTVLAYFLTLSILFVWVVSSIQFALSVEVSDACVNPQNTILQGINMTNNADIDSQTLEIVKYYIYCDRSHSYNPLHNYTMYAYNSLVSVNDTIYQILPLAPMCNITTQTNILFDDYISTLKELTQVEQSLKCEDINEYLTNITSDVCESGINYWFLCYLLQMIVIVLLITKHCCICTETTKRLNMSQSAVGDEKDKERQRRIEIRKEEGVESELSPLPDVIYSQIIDSKCTDKDMIN